MEGKTKINKERFFAFLFIASILFVFFVLLREGNENNIRETATVTIRETIIAVEIADTSEERALGLGGRKYLPENEGMFFIFEEPGNHAFWMRNMEFPLDIIWIDENFTIIHIEQGLTPGTFPKQYSSATSSQYVLEVNADFTKFHAISPGDQVIFERKNEIPK